MTTDGSGPISRLDLPGRLVNFSLDRPRQVLLFWALLLCVGLAGLVRLQIDTSTDSILDRTDPAFAFHKHSQELFGGEEVLVVALPSEEPFDPELLAEVERLTTELEALPDVRRIDSLQSHPVIRSEPDGTLSLDAALHQGIPRNTLERKDFEKRVRSDRVAGRTLYSDDGRVLAINVLLEGNTKGKFLEMVQGARELVGDRPAWISGVPVFRTEINTRTQSELLTLAPITAAILGVLLFAFFRSVAAVCIPLATGAVGSWMMLAWMGLAGTSLTLLSLILPSVVLALGSAYVMHLLSAAAGAADPAALRAALLRVARPVALSGLTTAIGFATSAVVRVDAVREVGGYGALGVFVVTAASLTAVPALLGLFPIPVRPSGPWLAGWLRSGPLDSVLHWAGSSRALLWGGWAAIAVALVVGLGQLRVETDATEWFREGAAVRTEYDQIRTHLAGISPVNIVIEAESGRSVIEPEVLQAVDQLSAFLAKRPDVGKAVSVADPLRQLHGGFVGDEQNPLPEGEALVEQYLLLLSSVESIGDLITPDFSAANVVLRVDDNASGALREVATSAEAWWKENGPPGFRAQGTGTMFEFARAEDELVEGQLRGLGLALLAIGAILWAVLGQFRLACLALVPNAVPILSIFGLMGWFGVALDAGTVILGSLALGIAVDDTMHIVNGIHQRGLQAHPPSRLDALRSTLSENLPALFYTTVSVSAAFAVLGLSDFTYIRNLGLLTAGIMVICLLADLLLLPSLLLARRASRQ